jgi:hypothetical protein
MNFKQTMDSENGLRHDVIAGMRSINIEKLMGHSVGISDSYYRATESEPLDDYLKAIPALTIGYI